MNVLLIGFMGSGKSRVGSLLAKQGGMWFVDLDKEFEKQEGMTISEAFRQKGEDYFRKRETEILQQQEGAENTVFATGGGIIVRKENRDMLKKLGKVVWLALSAEQAYLRTRGQGGRPLLEKGDREETIRKLMEERQADYAQTADIVVDVEEKTVEETVKEIVEKLK